MSAKNVIISAAVNYTAEDLQVLLRSAARYAPGAAFLIFHDRTDPDFRDQLARHHPEVHLMRPGDLGFRDALWRRRSRRRRLSHMSGPRALLWRLLLRTPWRAAATARLHIVMARYFWALDAFHLPLLSAARNVLLCDSRDVCFQADPFAAMPGALTVGAWNVPYSRRTQAVDWLRRRFPPDVVERVLPRPNLSNGLILGTRDAVRRFLEAFTRQIVSLRPHPFGQTGDQRVINAMLHGSDGVPFVLTPTGDALMAHLIQTDWKCFVIDDGGLKTRAGELVALLHHYEYHPRVLAHITKTYGTGVGRRPKMHPIRKLPASR